MITNIQGAGSILEQMKALKLESSGLEIQNNTNKVNQADFGQFLQNALNGVNNQMVESDNLKERFELGDKSISLSDVMISSQKEVDFKGEDFDIVYWDNEDDIEPTEGYPKYVKPPFIARYPFYDEADTSTLYLEFLHQFDRMMFEELNEYTVVLTSVILSNTEMDVWCRDARIFWFTGENDRIHLVDTFPENRFADTTLYIQEQHRCGLEDGNFKRLSAVYAFHNVFFLQWILNGRDVKSFKFLTLPINDAGGIGALLSAYTRNQALAERLGLKFVAPDKDHFGKYPRALVERYFAVDIWDSEATEANTLVVPGSVVINL